MLTCKRCGESFRPRSFGGHVSYCGKERVKCEICGRRVTKQLVLRHMKTHGRDAGCPTCGKLVYGWEDKKFCSQSCSAIFQNKDMPRRSKPLKYCIYCKKTLENSRSKFCNYVCLNEHKYEEYIRKWLAGEVTGNHRGEEAISKHVRRWLFERSGGRCEGKLDDGSRCGWARINPFTGKTPLTAHHKDGDARNTTPDNMELICPGCHSLTETYGGGNKGRGRNNRRKPPKC